MKPAQGIAKFFDRWLAFLLQALPGYRGQADSLLDDDTPARGGKLPQTAREADLPPKRR